MNLLVGPTDQNTRGCNPGKGCASLMFSIIVRIIIIIIVFIPNLIIGSM